MHAFQTKQIYYIKIKCFLFFLKRVLSFRLTFDHQYFVTIWVGITGVCRLVKQAQTFSHCPTEENDGKIIMIIRHETKYCYTWVKILWRSYPSSSRAFRYGSYGGTKVKQYIFKRERLHEYINKHWSWHGFLC